MPLPQKPDTVHHALPTNKYMITENEQYGYDYNWFMADKSGFIAHFGTGATILPKFVSTYCDHSFLISQTDFFLSLKEKDKNNYVLNPELSNIAKLAYSFTLEYYLDEPLQFVNRGLYSYKKLPERLRSISLSIC